MNWGHRVPFDGEPGGTETEYRLRIRVNDLTAENNRLQERIAQLEGELHHYKTQAIRKRWRR